MSALRRGRQKQDGASGWTLFGASVNVGHFVLPRLLRRPARLFARICDGSFQAPRFAATIVSAALLSSSVAYGAYLGGHLDDFVQGVTARTGFAVDQIKVVGNRETSEIDILDKLELNGWTSLVGFDATAARDRIASLAWVEFAAVRKIYPHTLEIRVDERKAFALWQQGSSLNVIERSGRIIAPFSGGALAALPLIVGPGAPEHAPALLAIIDKFPQLAARVKGYVRVGDRRWDLKLDDGVTIKLPESDENAALASLVKLDREDGLLNRDIVAVDMRLPDRLALELSPEGLSARKVALAEKSKNASRDQGKNI